ncbi:4-hydroxythreonine-4-phosphate dehydrogenase PdxA [bacterium]|nr:4-hydroxythreonine-4-phosphate dehydrogenase PdxA [bacterium]
MKKSKPVIAISLGDPLGIGWEITQKALKDPAIKKLARFEIFGTPFNKIISLRKAGELSAQALDQATQAVMMGECDALVTAPVSKTHLKLAGFPFPGQTEYLADVTETKNSAMMLASPQLKVVLVTIHVPLAKVPALITPKKILEKIILTHASLKKDFGIKKPKIAVCGLNPHAGEGGMFGNEEKFKIIPAIKSAQKKKIVAVGPLPPDTVFHEAKKVKYDAVVCMYHDQGLIALKTLDFDRGVNLTMGLPIIRTSPDHGPAFDIAGKNKANASAFKEAIKTAVTLWKNRLKS